MEAAPTDVARRENGVCPNCRHVDSITLRPRWRAGRRYREPTTAECNAMARGRCDESTVTANGWILMPCWQVLAYCAWCRRSWWSSQRALIGRAAQALGMPVPDLPKLETRVY